MGKLRSRPVLTSVAAVLAGASVAFLSVGPDAQAAPLPLLPLPEQDASELDDGYNHFVVEVPADEVRAPDAPESGPDEQPDAAPPSSAPGATDTDTDAAAGALPYLDVAKLEALGDRVERLSGDGDVVYAVLDDGTRVRVDIGGADDAPEPQPGTPEPELAPVASPEPVGEQQPQVPGSTMPVPPTIDRLDDLEEVIEVSPAGGPYWSVSTTMDAAAFEAAATEAGAVSVVEDQIAYLDSNDPYSDWMWGLENRGDLAIAGVAGVEDADVDGVEARAAVEGNGVVVAVVDTGIQLDHPDLPALWRNPGEVSCTNGVDDDANGYVDDCNGWDFANNDNTVYDTGPGVNNDHGTHVAGTIAGIPDNGRGGAGLAPGVTVMSVKAINKDSMWVSAGAAAIRYAVDNGADIINASWGTNGAVSIHDVPYLDAAVDYANAHGVIVVAAAGNDGANLDQTPQFPASLPQDNVISVGASMPNDQPASFSNYSTTDVDLFAPGYYIIASVDGSRYGAMSGTSMAAPHVTAAGAMVIAQNPTASVAEIRSRLLSAVDPVPAFSSRSATGGRLNAARALGLRADDGDPFTVTVAGLDQIAPDVPAELAVTAEMGDPAIADGRAVEVRASVLAALGGDAYAVTGLPLTVNGTEQVTDDLASVAITEPMDADSGALRSGVTAQLTTTLPAGTYALAFELVDAADPGVAYGPVASVYFTVGDPDDGGSPAPTTQPVDPGDGWSPAPTTQPSDPGRGGGGGPAPTTRPSDPADPGRGPTTPTPPAPDPGAGGGSPTPTTRPSDPGRGGGGSPAPTTQPSDPGRGGGGGPAPTTRPSDPADPGRGPTTPTPPTPDPGDGGGSPTPTTRPSDPGRGGGPTPTPTTEPPGPSPTEPQEPVSNDGMTITSVSPTSGPADGGTMVVVRGSGFTEHVRVLFGGRAGLMSSRRGSRLVVRTPSGAPGTVDVTVADHLGNDVTMRDVFTYLADPDDPGGGGPAPTSPPSDPGDPGTTPTTRPTDPGGGGSPTPTTEPLVPSSGRHRLTTSGTPITYNGLTLVKVLGSPVSAPPSAWDSLACRSATCVAVLKV